MHCLPFIQGRYRRNDVSWAVLGRDHKVDTCVDLRVGVFLKAAATQHMFSFCAQVFLTVE